MQFQMRARGNPARVAVVLTGDTFEIKDTLRAHGFRFDRNAIDWCGLPETTGHPIWWKVICSNNLSTELAFTQPLANLPNLVMIVTYPEAFE